MILDNFKQWVVANTLVLINEASRLMAVVLCPLPLAMVVTSWQYSGGSTMEVGCGIWLLRGERGDLFAGRYGGLFW